MGGGRRFLVPIAIVLWAAGALAGTALGGGGSSVSISPSAKDFGSLSIGDSETETFEISGVGEVESVDIEGTNSSDFQLVSDQCSGEVLGPGDSCTVRVSFSPSAGGLREAVLTVVACDSGPVIEGVAAAGSDCSSDEASLRGTGVAPGDPAPPLPSAGTAGVDLPPYFPADPPVPARSFVGRVIRGTVLVQLPGSTEWIGLPPDFRNLPNGTRIDARRGIAILMVDNGNGQYDTVTIWEGVIDVFNLFDTGGARSTLQATRTPTITELRLSFRAIHCPSRRAGSRRAGDSAESSGHRRRRSRRIWAQSRRGRFRTRGRYAAATVRGTRWLTRDLCGRGRGRTGVFVDEGRVLVTNLVTGRTRTIFQGRGFSVHSP